MPMQSRLMRIFLVGLLLGCTDGKKVDPKRIIKQRPSTDATLFDYVGLMADVKESTHRYLEAIRNRYGIEILIVALPSLENDTSINEAAAALFTNWKVGKKYHGRGILLLLVDDAKKVKLEVGYELEDVFTDAFTGYIQDMHLQPRYTANQLDIGFIAVMEAFESRAQIKSLGNYTSESIADLDADYLSQGAGAARNLDTYPRRSAPQQPTFNGEVNTAYPAGKTPVEAWQTLLRRWQDKIKDPHLGVYTPVTRLTYRDFMNMPDSRLEKEYHTYAAKNYTVLQDGDYAVIFFGKKTGWDNSPFLLCRTREGWQFDIVHQRRFIRMGKAPHWGVEFSEHPHMQLLLEAFHFRGQDIPIQADDRYTIDRDTQIAKRILEYEHRIKNEPDSADALLALGRLYTITSMNQKGIPLLKKALESNPADPRPLKYLAIAHVDAYYQYDTAQTHLAAYIKAVPDDPFGHNFSGYIHYRKKDYQAAAKAFERALSLDADNCYAHFYLSYTYAWLYANASKLDPGRATYKQRFNDHKEKTRSFASAHPIRVLWLNRWLDK
jgi:tetratricopeptide (TPR) repeat protein